MLANITNARTASVEGKNHIPDTQHELAQIIKQNIRQLVLPDSTFLEKFHYRTKMQQQNNIS